MSLRKRANISCSRVWMSMFFSSNCSKFAAKCDWNGKISQNVQNLGFFFRKKDGFFEKKLNIAVECVSSENVSLKSLFSSHCEIYLAKKNRKLWTLEKLENLTKKQCFFSKKIRFHLSNLHLCQIGKAQNIPVVAGRFVHDTFRILDSTENVGLRNDFYKKWGRRVSRPWCECNKFDRRFWKIQIPETFNYKKHKKTTGTP